MSVVFEMGGGAALSVLFDRLETIRHRVGIVRYLRELRSMAEESADRLGILYVLGKERPSFAAELDKLHLGKYANLDNMIEESCDFYKNICAGRYPQYDKFIDNFVPHKIYKSLRVFNNLIQSNLLCKITKARSQLSQYEKFNIAIQSFNGELFSLLNKCEGLSFIPKKNDPTEIHDDTFRKLEDPFLFNKWIEASTNHRFSHIVPQNECAWVIQWYRPVAPESVILRYHPEKQYANNDTAPLNKKLKSMIPTEGENLFANMVKLQKEPYGLQVRVDAVNRDAEQNVNIDLSPTKYLYYKFIQARLGSPKYKSIREQFFNDALNDLCEEKISELPNQFALHMAIVSSDNKLLIRQRRGRNYTTLYPQAWEVGIGEFMHGPEKQLFKHFKDSVTPDIKLFLKQAVAEELNYFQAKTSDFGLYGFAIEYETLAPKLLVVYKSDLSIDAIKEGAMCAKDGARDVSDIDLSIDGVASICRKNEKYPYWGPTSRLVAVLSLLQFKTKNEKEVNDILKRLKADI